MTFPPRGRPRTETPILTALIRHVIKNVTNEELQQIMKERGRDPTSDNLSEGATCILEPGNLELLSGLAKGTDLEDEARALTEKVRVSSRSSRVASQAAALRPQDAAQAGAASSSSKPADRRPRFHIPSGVISAAEAKQWKPVAKGCSLVKDLKWHGRWVGTYSLRPAPNHVTKVFGGTSGLSECEALTHVLQKLWEWHGEHTGEPCPFAGLG